MSWVQRGYPDTRHRATIATLMLPGCLVMARDAALPAGDTSIDQQFAQLYAELKRLAHAQRRAEAPDTLNTTALVHDLYLQRADRTDLDFREPARFYAYAAKAMRHLLIDRARARARIKVGGDQVRVDIDAQTTDEWSVDALIGDAATAMELDSALNALQREDVRAAEIVELYLFAGLTIERIAEVRQLSTRTVDRDWRFARAFLQAALNPS